MIVSTQRSKSGPRRAERPGSFWSPWMVSTVTSMARRWLQRCCGAWRRKWCLGCSVPPIPTMTESLSYLVTRGPTFKFHSDVTQDPKIIMYCFMCYFSKLLLLITKQRPPPHTHTHTLWAPFYGTFLQTLPDLVTPLKGHSSSPCSCPATQSLPSERFRY